jgi:hypothetical protein
MPGVNDKISRVQRLLVESEGAVKDARHSLRVASHAQSALHELAAELLAEYGHQIGADSGVVASIITPKQPN